MVYNNFMGFMQKRFIQNPFKCALFCINHQAAVDKITSKGAKELDTISYGKHIPSKESLVSPSCEMTACPGHAFYMTPSVPIKSLLAYGRCGQGDKADRCPVRLHASVAPGRLGVARSCYIPHVHPTKEYPPSPVLLVHLGCRFISNG